MAAATNAAGTATRRDLGPSPGPSIDRRANPLFGDPLAETHDHGSRYDEIENHYQDRIERGGDISFASNPPRHAAPCGRLGLGARSAIVMRWGQISCNFKGFPKRTQTIYTQVHDVVLALDPPLRDQQTLGM